MGKTNTIVIAPDKPWLAPLAGWSDLAFRLICREEGAFVACTEMVSAKGLVYGGKNTEDLLATQEADNPLVVQIFGAEAEFMEKAIFVLQNRGFQNFDVNVGCSVTKVVKTGAGAAMLRDVENLLKVANRVIMQSHAPKILENASNEPHISQNLIKNFESKGLAQKKGKIGFKVRLGYELGKDVYEDVARELEILGADWLTLHPRYAKQAFHGVPNYDALTKLKANVRIPIIASGDLFHACDGVRVLMETGVDGIMYARGAMANPRIFQEHIKLWNYMQSNTITSDFEKYAPQVLERSDEEMREDLASLIRRHLKYAKAFNPRRALLQMRTIVPRYVKHLENAKSLRLALIACKSFEELEAILQQNL